MLIDWQSCTSFQYGPILPWERWQCCFASKPLFVWIVIRFAIQLNIEVYNLAIGPWVSPKTAMTLQKSINLVQQLKYELGKHMYIIFNWRTCQKIGKSWKIYGMVGLWPCQAQCKVTIFYLYHGHCHYGSCSVQYLHEKRYSIMTVLL